MKVIFLTPMCQLWSFVNDQTDPILVRFISASTELVARNQSPESISYRPVVSLDSTELKETIRKHRLLRPEVTDDCDHTTKIACHDKFDTPSRRSTGFHSTMMHTAYPRIVSKESHIVLPKNRKSHPNKL